MQSVIGPIAASLTHGFHPCEPSLGPQEALLSTLSLQSRSISFRDGCVTQFRARRTTKQYLGKVYDTKLRLNSHYRRVPLQTGGFAIAHVAAIVLRQ
jgi:hypothetical protein